MKLEPYFGKTAQFPLETTITVKKGDIVALTVPTWAPALALGFGNDTSWRASRQKSQCTSTSSQTRPHAGRQPGAVLLPVPDRAPDLQRDADLHALAASLHATRRGAYRAGATAPARVTRLRRRQALGRRGDVGAAARARSRRPSGSSRRRFGPAFFVGAFRFRFGFFSPPAEVPPPMPPRSSSEELSLDSEPPPSLLEALSPVVPVVLLPVLVVDVVCAAAFSALVSVGGVMSGVLLGTAIGHAAAAA